MTIAGAGRHYKCSIIGRMQNSGAHDDIRETKRDA
jgi:hypothetical protein